LTKFTLRQEHKHSVNEREKERYYSICEDNVVNIWIPRVFSQLWFIIEGGGG